MKSVIKEAHDRFSPLDESQFKVKAHDIRAIATSLAFSRNVALDRRLEAANWKTKNIFADVYPKEFSFKYNDIFNLGPLVAAQSVLA